MGCLCLRLLCKLPKFPVELCSSHQKEIPTLGHKGLEYKLQSQLDALVSQNKDIFSALLGVADLKGDIYWAGASGTAYAENIEGMKVDTPFFIASITKIYTSAVTMILEEREILSLKDPLSKFLPEDLLEGLHRYKGVDYTNQLRVYHLVSHTSGLPDYFMGKPKGGKSLFDHLVTEGDTVWDLTDVVDITKNQLTPKFRPELRNQIESGKKAYYSDTNYQLLGTVIESAARKSLDKVLSELILEPLELSSTYLHGRGLARVNLDSSPATIYYKERPLHLDQALRSSGPDGGMVSTIEDGLKFLKNFIGGKLFTHHSTLERMKNWKKIFFPLQYGLGLMRYKLPRVFSPFSETPELIGHSGATSSFLFHSDIGQLLICGTLNQLENQARPFRLMHKVINMINEFES